METSTYLKLFISYSHQDEEYVNKFLKHISPLKKNGLIQEWYDRKIIAGRDFQNDIDNNLENADIICLCISANFLSSAACENEKLESLKLKKKKGISVIPIILSDCGWKDDNEISSLLVLPLDGKPVSNFSPDHNKGWSNVYEGLKSVINQENFYNNLQLSNNFSSFLNNTELLTKAHSNKSEIFLEDIFVYPELLQYDELNEDEKTINAENLLDGFSHCSKLLIAGEDQAGKTTLSKKLFTELRNQKYIPIYISDKKNHFHGKIETKIIDSFKEQYINTTITDFEKIDINRIVLIVDDFHFATKKEKIVGELAPYCHQILIVDDIFSINFKDEKIIKSYTQYLVKQFNPSLRNELIEKWMLINENKSNIKNKNEHYNYIDNATELVNTTLGKLFSSGIMPAFPFFILSVMSAYETFEKPLNQEITSQGYCYQALIYMYLRKQGVLNEDIDTYINFLSEFSYYIYIEKKSEINTNEFMLFMTAYKAKYNLPVKEDTLLKKLYETKILCLDSFGNILFSYPYIYYFFVAKYLSENLYESESVVNLIIRNLHKDENSYIAIFITHHSKSSYLLEEIMLNAILLFDDLKEATLDKGELGFFDIRIEKIVNAVLPSNAKTPEAERIKRLKEQDLIEEEQKNNHDHETIESSSVTDGDVIERDLRRSIKTVEVMGSIIKNRAGSLEKDLLEEVFERALDVHLRILTSFFEVIEDENYQDELVDYISKRLDKLIASKTKTSDREHLKKISIDLFWNVCFTIIYGIINKTITSIGSNKLAEVIQKVCDKKDTPAAFLVKHGILMWFNKSLKIDEISDNISKEKFSETSKRILRLMIVEHCSLHKISPQAKQKIMNKLGIPTHRLFKKDISP